MGITPKLFIKAPTSGKAKASEPVWDVPRLARALFEADAGTEPFRSDLEKASALPSTDAGHKPKVSLRATDRAKFLAELKDLCAHLRFRLQGSLAEAWMGKGGYPTQEFKALLLKAHKEKKTPTDAVDKSKADLAEAAAFYDSGEEQWARAFCEMVVFTMYHSAGIVYGTGGRNKVWYDRFPAVYSVAMACQTMSTYCCLSRGLTGIGPNGFGCTGGTEKEGAFEKGLKKTPRTDAEAKAAAEADLRRSGKLTDATPEEEKKRLIAAKLPNAQNYTPSWATPRALVNEGARPGSVIVFNGGGYAYPNQDYRPGTTHIASVLRIVGQQIQFIDTGVVTGYGESGPEAGAVDHNLTTTYIPSAQSAVAFGVAKQVTEAALISGAKDLAKSKPLAVMRLVVADAEKKAPLFVSKLLHMRWHLSKLIWSLRNLPEEGLLVAWLVWAPHSTPSSEKLADALAGKMRPASKLISGKLALTHLIVSGYKATPNDTMDVHVYRSHVLSDWYTEGGTKVSAIPLLSSLKLGNTKLLEWAENSGNFDKCYIRTMATGDAGGPSNEAINDDLVDPPADSGA